MATTTTIDVEARLRSAKVYRYFAAALLTNDQMEDALPRSFERGLHDIFLCGIWPLYDDLHEHKLTGRYRLTPEGRDHVARIILFLQSSLPYRWPLTTGWRGVPFLILAVLSFGIYRPLRRGIRDSGGHESVWPFFSRAEYESALKHPPFLHATKSA
jgi:hypothetical protein